MKGYFEASGASSEVQGLVGGLDDVLGMGLEFATRLEIDATLAALEAAYCATVTK